MATSSDVDIANLSLDMLNVAPITSIDTPVTPTEETIERWFDQTRRQALRRHPWNFAEKRAILAPDSTDPLFGWEKQFVLPTDYIRIMHLNESVIIGNNPVPQKLFRVAANKILIGGITGVTATQVNIVYVSDFKTVPRMDPLFIDYFSTLLAQNVAYKMTQSNAAVTRVNKLMKDAEQRARAMDGQENPPIRVERSRNRRARRNLGGARNLDGIIVFD